MKITSSYSVEIKNLNKLLYPTISIFRNAVSFCIKNLENDWHEIKTLNGKSQNNYCENLLHTSGNNTAKYKDFDKLFYKMPTYFRRNVVSTALGVLKSYHSNLENWNNGIGNGCPSLSVKNHQFPTFYKGNVYAENDLDYDKCKLKLFINNDWVWTDIRLKHTDMQYIRNHCKNSKMSNPTLKRKNHKWVLEFAFTEEVKLNNTRLNNQIAMAVDLGINTDATCSIMTADGTVLAREFINFSSEKDQLYHTLNKIKKVQQRYGYYNTQKLWRIAKFHNEELARKIAKQIVYTATLYNCDVIVFEHLDTKGKITGSKKQKLAMWKKNTIQNITEHKAHKNSIRVTHVCAWGTSKLAFDGSGKVLRGKDADLSTYELCKFSNGKIYNCDLSASYNIGARYFIREIQKIQSEKNWSRILAKVPECGKRTLCTYSTLLEINKVG